MHCYEYEELRNKSTNWSLYVSMVIAKLFTMLKLKGAIETLKDHTRDELQEKLGVRQSSIVMTLSSSVWAFAHKLMMLPLSHHPC